MNDAVGVGEAGTVAGAVDVAISVGVDVNVNVAIVGTIDGVAVATTFGFRLTLCRSAPFACHPANDKVVLPTRTGESPS